MNEFQAWDKILLEWKQVNRIKRLNQQLYDQLGGAMMCILDYSKKNNIPLANRDSLFRMIDNIHGITGTIKEFNDEINSSSDDSLQQDKPTET